MLVRPGLPHPLQVFEDEAYDAPLIDDDVDLRVAVTERSLVDVKAALASRPADGG